MTSRGTIPAHGRHSSPVRRPLLAHWWLFLGLAAASTAIFGYFLPQQRDTVTADGARGSKLLDEYLPTWTHEQGREFLTALGPAGRAAYQQFYVGFDFYFPVLTSSLALCAFIALMLRYTPEHRWLIMSPVVPYLFDVAENITHYTLAGNWPDDGGLLWTVAPVFTAAKWLSLVCIIAIAAFTVRVRLTSGSPRRTRPTPA